MQCLEVLAPSSSHVPFPASTDTIASCFRSHCRNSYQLLLLSTTQSKLMAKRAKIVFILSKIKNFRIFFPRVYHAELPFLMRTFFLTYDCVWNNFPNSKSGFFFYHELLIFFEFSSSYPCMKRRTSYRICIFRSQSHDGFGVPKMHWRKWIRLFFMYMR